MLLQRLLLGSLLSLPASLIACSTPSGSTHEPATPATGFATVYSVEYRAECAAIECSVRYRVPGGESEDDSFPEGTWAREFTGNSGDLLSLNITGSRYDRITQTRISSARVKAVILVDGKERATDQDLETGLGTGRAQARVAYTLP